jgi:hypothetical protein
MNTILSKTKKAFGLLEFSALEEIFDEKLFGLDEEGTEEKLDELREIWYGMTEDERKEYLEKYKL